MNRVRAATPPNASMRPGPEGPGCGEVFQTTALGHWASMRPGPEGPGCLVDMRAVGGPLWASMRPGPEGPGCSSLRVADGLLRIGFNEAGAGRPRMLA